MLNLPLSPDLGAKLLAEAVLRAFGGRGSGNFNHEGRPGQRGGSGDSNEGENPAASRILSKLAATTKPSETYFITPTGRRLNLPKEVGWGGKLTRVAHEDAVGGEKKLKTVLNSGVVRNTPGTGAEIYGPLSLKQAQILESDYMRSGAYVDVQTPNGEIASKRFEPFFAADDLHSWATRQRLTNRFLEFAVLGGKGSGNFGHSGRPGERGGSGEALSPREREMVEKYGVYHGTSRAALASIAKHGLVPGKGGGGDEWLQNKKGAKAQALQIEDRHTAVYFTNNKMTAHDYADRVSELTKTEGIVLSVRIPKSLMDRIEIDPGTRTKEGFEPNSFRLKGSIPAKYISVYEHGERVPLSKFRAGEEGEETELEFFAVFHTTDDLRTAGGRGSGNYGHSGRKGEVGGSAEGHGEDKVRSEKSARALKAFKPIHAEAQRYAEENEQLVRKMIGGSRTDDNKPVDVVTTIDGKVKGIEIKTLVNNTNDKITMRRGATEKKEAWKRENHATVHTVVIDDRKNLGNKGYSGHWMYYRKGYGSFRLGSMVKVESAAHLKRLLSR